MQIYILRYYAIDNIKQLINTIHWVESPPKILKELLDSQNQLTNQSLAIVVKFFMYVTLVQRQLGLTSIYEPSLIYELTEG